MSARLPRPAVLLLATVVLFGAWRALDAAHFRREALPEVDRPEAPAASQEPPVLERARARDRMAEEWAERPIPRDPFRGSAPSAPPPAPSPSEAIPRIARALGEGEGRTIVLAFGRSESRPLAVGGSDRGWTVLSIQERKALVEHDGVIYSLPIP